MAGYRRARINDAMQAELSTIFREIKDPRISGAFLTVTACDVTPDLKFAKVYFSFMQGEVKEIMRGLSAASPYIRRRIAESLNLRITPEFTFVHDVSLAHGAHIATLLNQIERERAEKTPTDTEGKNDADTDA
ncbi:MAG: 30S ribosome-binding factor RbfA [Clostridia bacterium]|nr:30S ribosome-binding factor RbfA [Clostridia bacterium]